jgi:uncharacterized SAM-binding protein YcdF (DUF218 family)
MALFLALIGFALVWAIGFFYFVMHVVPSYHPPASFEIQALEEKPQAIVVLTGGRLRLTKAVEMLSQGHADRLFISGVSEGNDLITTLILSGPLPDGIHLLVDNIELGYAAGNTRGNAVETLEWTRNNNITSIYMVTANYHMPRSVLLFDQYAPNLQVIPVPIISPGVEVKDWFSSDGSKRLLMSEYNKYIITVILHWIGLG